MKRRAFIRLLGGAAAWPLAARAQQSERMRRIGVLMSGAEADPELQARVTAFRQKLEQYGWSEGRNIHIDIRFSAIRSDEYQALAKEMVALQPDVIFGHTTPVVAALQRESRTVPIVFVNVSDPLGSGLVTSLAHPGGNITGLMLYEEGNHRKMAGPAQRDRATSQARRPHGQSHIDAVRLLRPLGQERCAVARARTRAQSDK
jgi:ABC-type uncharacterized transport system substrate-binding protein